MAFFYPISHISHGIWDGMGWDMIVPSHVSTLAGTLWDSVGTAWDTLLKCWDGLGRTFEALGLIGTRWDFSGFPLGFAQKSSIRMDP